MKPFFVQTCIRVAFCFGSDFPKRLVITGLFKSTEARASKCERLVEKYSS